MTETTDAAPQDPTPERVELLNQERLQEYSNATPQADRGQAHFRDWWEQAHPEDFEHYQEPSA